MEGGLILGESCNGNEASVLSTLGTLSIDIKDDGTFESIESDNSDLNCHETADHDWECTSDTGITIWLTIESAVPDIQQFQVGGLP